MRVVLAPDSFGGSLSAAEAATAIAAGWAAAAPADELDLAPMSDGGRGFIEVLQASIGGHRHSVTVPDPLGRPVEAAYLVRDATAYVEAAEAIGLHLLGTAELDPRRAGSRGLGELIAAAARTAPTVVVGLGGTATNDGGAGLWAGLGAEPADGLAAGPIAAAAVRTVVVPTMSARLVVASDVENPLLGPNGASAVFGPQKGADRATVLDLDDALRAWADAVDAGTGRSGLRNEAGAGAAGGCGFALFALGAERRSGCTLVADAIGLAERIAGADLVVTGEGAFDATSLRGKVVAGVADLARSAGVPCVVVAGRAEVGRRDAAAAGIDEAYAVTDVLGSAAAALAAGADGVAAAAERAARAWGGSGGRG